MQTLGATTVFPCYAPADRALASQTAAFLENGADVRVFLEEGELPPGVDLAEKAREARTAEIVLVFFSHHSLPRPWPRSKWEDALVNEPAAENVRIAFLKCDECLPPRVLANQFDLSVRPVDGWRALKRWVRGDMRPYAPPSPDLEHVISAVADRPGMQIVHSIDLAQAAAGFCAADFDATARLHCPGRTLTALAGDLAWQLGLKVENDLAANLDRLERHCCAHRILILLEAPPDEIAEALVFGGRCSTILSTQAGQPTSDPLHEAQRILLAATRDWPELCRQARKGRQIATAQGRLAECYELMQQWNALADERADRSAADEAARELKWILEAWGNTEEALEVEAYRAREYDQQMSLF